MGKLSTKKINTADYSQMNREDVGKLARSLNPFMDDVERLFRKGLTVEDNLQMEYITFTGEVDGTGTPKNTLQFTVNLTTNIKGCIVVNATNPNVYPTSSPYVATSINGTNLQIKKILGLPADTKFEITLLIVS
jgi:hypothetical protein